MSADKTLSCRDCQSSFTWTAGEQDYFASKGFNQPSRCSSCRSSRKNGGSDNRSEQRAPAREMFDAYCQAGNHTVRVPFQVDTNRPWSCRDHKDAAKAAREASMHEVYCGTGAHTVKVPFEPDLSRPFTCRDHRDQAKAAREASMHEVYCVAGGHTTRVPFEPDPTRDFNCRDHREQAKAMRAASRKDVYCDAGSHMVSVPQSFNKDDSRSWTCKDCKNNGLGLTLRQDRKGDFSSSSRSVPGTGLTFHQDSRGRSTGSSQRVSGTNLTFHQDSRGNSTGYSERIPGLGLTFNHGRDGKLKSTTDRNGFRTGRNGGFKGSSKRF